MPQGECLYFEKCSVDLKAFKWCPTGSGALVVNGANGFVRFYEFECASRGTPRATLASSHKLVGFPDSMDTTAVAIDVTGEFVAVGSNDGSICVWDAGAATLDRAIRRDSTRTNAASRVSVSTPCSVERNSRVDLSTATDACGI